jgi:GNAT superfamily N-acetyltransferase
MTLLRTMPYSVDIIPPASASYGDFLTLPERLYAGDPLWRPPGPPGGEMEPTCFVVRKGNEVVGRVCGVVNSAMIYRDRVPALLGWYECTDDSEASGGLLDAACAYYSDRGYADVIGPIDGSTWNRYRLARPSAEPPFFLDVYHKPWYPGQWEAEGFTTISEYRSTSFDDLHDDYRDLDRREEELRDRGISIRTIDPEDFEGELRILYDLSVRGFAGNFLYTPIDYERFAEMYRPVKPLVHPEFVLIATAGDAPVAFVFAVDDIYATVRKSLVMKSAAVLPAWRGAGLGHHLLERVHRSAYRAGYGRIIHALMREDNRSRNILAGRSRPLRSYRLYARELRPAEAFAKKPSGREPAA